MKRVFLLLTLLLFVLGAQAQVQPKFAPDVFNKDTSGIVKAPLVNNGTKVLVDTSWVVIDTMLKYHAVEPLYKIGAGTSATANTDNVYLMGNVSLGKSTSTSLKLEVAGQIKADSSITALNYASTVQALASGAWDLNKGANASWNLSAGANTLTISNVKAGMYGLIKLVNSGTSTLNLPGSSKVINGGAGQVTLTQTAGAVDIMTFYYDGNFYYWTIGYNYN
jgi:hypothetical protein